MNRRHDERSDATRQALTISRDFAAPRDLVFKAWSSAAHMKRWFSPAGCSAPEAEVDFRPGGVCAICIRLPDGRDHWARGVYEEILPPDRLVLTLGVVIDGAKRFTARTVVTFEDAAGGTRMTVRQAYDIHDDNYLSPIDGAREGWRTTLDKLEREVARMKGAGPRSVVHASFSLERVFDASPARLFRALTDKDAKARWFGGGEGHETLERTMDVRPGGRERLKARWTSGVVADFNAVYYDVVPEERLVYAYEMSLDDDKISVSLATLELTPAGAGARLKITEQGAFLDGFDDANSRERGTAWLLDRLAASLREGV